MLTIGQHSLELHKPKEGAPCYICKCCKRSIDEYEYLKDIKKAEEYFNNNWCTDPNVERIVPHPEFPGVM